MPWFANRAKLAVLICLTFGQLMIIFPTLAGQPFTIPGRPGLSVSKNKLDSKDLKLSLKARAEEQNIKSKTLNLGESKSALFRGGCLSGGSCGGGGGVIYLNDQPSLVDFYNIQGSYEMLSNRYSSKKSSAIQFPVRMRFNADQTVDIPAMKIVLEIFKQWSALPYDSIGFWINSAIFKPEWNFTDEKLVAPKSYVPPVLIDAGEVKTVAFYLQKDETYNVNISREIWNQLPIQDQAGVLIHETLRHVQIGLSFGFDDEALQKATAMMMACIPGVKFDQYLFYLLNNRRDLAELRFESFEQLTKECGK